MPGLHAVVNELTTHFKNFPMPRAYRDTENSRSFPQVIWSYPCPNRFWA